MKIKLLPLPADDPLQACDLGIKHLDPAVPPVLFHSPLSTLRTQTQLALPSVETSPVNTQFARQLSNVVPQLHPPDRPFLKFLRVPLLHGHRPSPFNEKCRTPICL